MSQSADPNHFQGTAGIEILNITREIKKENLELRINRFIHIINISGPLKVKLRKTDATDINISHFFGVDHFANMTI